MITEAFSLKGKTALVTGAGKGIGARIATAFAEMGANVILVARTQSDIDRVAEEVRDFGVTATALACDITSDDSVANMFTQVEAATASLDILVNNAGAAGRGYGSLEQVDKTAFTDTVDINLTAAYHLIHLALPLLKKAPNAAIVNVSSAMSWMVDKNFAAYAAAKAGLDQMTRILAYELAPAIRVNGIAPGAIETPATAFITSNEKRLTETERWIPQGRLGQPIDIALAALYLASPASGFVSGKILEVDGGMAALPGSAIQARLKS
jgi:7-alpha-hydroxysteroid dehydrogenase